MKASIIIPTYNGAHKIMNALRSLEKQTCMPDEVIVVVDGSTDNTVGLLKQQQFNFASFKVIEQENGGRAKVRNRGAKEASGQLLIFLDDDMIVPEGWVKEHINHHKIHHGTIVTGKLEDPNKDEGDDFQKFKSWLNDKWNKTLLNDKTKSFFELTYPYITANNFSISTETFANLHGFDDRLTDAEDYDLAKRAIIQGIPLYFSYLLFAWHNDVVNCKKYILRMRQYTKAQQVLIEIKPDLYANGSRYSAKSASIIKATIFFFLCSKWWINSVDKKHWTWLPPTMRFKLYDLIVTANGSVYPEKVKL